MGDGGFSRLGKQVSPSREGAWQDTLYLSSLYATFQLSGFKTEGRDIGDRRVLPQTLFRIIVIVYFENFRTIYTSGFFWRYLQIL